MNCIFCSKPVENSSLEHIVPESLGNEHYTLALGAICRSCNNSFSDFEGKALGKSMLGFERARLGIATKKGNAAQAQSHNIKFVGNKSFKKNFVTVSGIEEKDIEEITEDGQLKVRILDFDKSDMATAKLVLKIGMESIFQSRRRLIYNKYDFTELKEHLTKVNNENWPILTIRKPDGFISVPRFMDNKRLKQIGCEILFKEIDQETLLLCLRYSVLYYVVNLRSRSIAWAAAFMKAEEMAQLYPKHLRKRILKH